MKKLAVLCLTLVMLSFCIPVKVMAEGDEGQVEYTVVYWQQLISDDKTLSDAEKHYKNAGVVQKTAVAGTQVTPEMAADIPVGFYLNTVRSDKSITPRKYGSVRLNVYLDRELITMTFNSANGDTENVYTGLYGQSLAQNGYIWPQGLWSYINDEGSSMFMSYLGDFILSITGTSITFTKNSGDNRNIYFYLQNLDGTYELVWHDSHTMSGKVDSFFEAPITTYKGFYFDEENPNNMTWKILSWNVWNNEFDVYYKRVQSPVIIRNLEEGISSTTTWGGDYLYEQPVTLTVTPLIWWAFDGWSVIEWSLSWVDLTQETLSFNMPAEKVQVSPNLHQIVYSITYSDLNNVYWDVVFTGHYWDSTSGVVTVPTWIREGYSLSWSSELPETYPATNTVIKHMMEMYQHE